MIFPLVLIAGAIGGIAYAVTRKKDGGTALPPNTNPPGRMLPTGITVTVTDGEAYLDVTNAFHAYRWATTNAKSKGITQSTPASEALPLMASMLPGVGASPVAGSMRPGVGSIPIAAFRFSQLAEPSTDDWDMFVDSMGETTWGELVSLAEAGMQSKGIAGIA